MFRLLLIIMIIRMLLLVLVLLVVVVDSHSNSKLEDSHWMQEHRINSLEQPLCRLHYNSSSSSSSSNNNRQCGINRR